MFRIVLVVLLLAGTSLFSQDTKNTPQPIASDPLNDASRLFQQGQFDAAIQKYQQIIANNPKSSAAYAGLTRVYLKQENVRLADETITKGVQVADGPFVRVALGEVYFREGKISDAEREWVNVINSGHIIARAYLGLARINESLSFYKKAKDKLDKAHQLDPDDPLHIPGLKGAQSSEPHAFWNKIQYAAGHRNFGHYPFRVNTALSSPVANLDVEGRIGSLTIPAKLSKNEISETMAIAANAERIFREDLAGDAARVLTRQAAGFGSRLMEVEAVSPSDFLRTALKGSTAWIKGTEGNSYTRFLRDWNGDFTRSDRTFLHSMFSNERLLARHLGPGVTHPGNLSSLF